MTTTLQTFLVARDDLGRTRLAAGPLPEPADGELLVRIDRIAFTANNITYAEMGERMGYWRFFPAPEGFGIVPAWGFGDVLVSRHAVVSAGERLYGFWPMATHVVLRPDRVAAGSFVDASEHRQPLPAAYNLYQRCAGDPSYVAADEDWQALLRPLFVTSFLLDDFLADAGFFGATRVWLSSASSKVALALAHLLRSRGGVEVMGLTSAAHRDVVAALGVYRRVWTYADVPALPNDGRAVFVDFAGGVALRRAVHTRLGEGLVYSSAVGMAHRDAEIGAAPPPTGVKPVFFFAPERLRQRARDWGREGLEQRIGQAWRAFLPVARGWLEPVHSCGPEAVARVYEEALHGRVPPRTGHVLMLGEGPGQD
ncbi:MAG: DUF2855 family protein [Rubrivivax sp.]|nr:DUF2855 family protein [Rubrivivax sp.]